MLSRQPASRTYLLICAGLLALGVSGVASILWVRTYEQTAYLAILLVFTALVATLVTRRYLRGELNWFEPGVLIPCLFLASFGFGGLRYFAKPEALHPLIQGDPVWLTLALLFTLLGVLAFWTGYYGRIGVALHQLMLRPARQQLQAQASIRGVIAMGLYFVGLAARLVMLRAGLYGYLKDSDSSPGSSAELLVRLESLSRIALVLAWLDSYSHPDHKLRRWFAWGLLFFEMFWGFVSGMKIFIILPLVLVTIIHAYKRGRLPIRHIAATALILVLVYPVNGIYRQLVRTGDVEIRQPADIVNASSVLADEILFSFDDPNIYLGSGYESAVARTSLIQSYAMLLKYLDQTGDYWHGRYIWMMPALVLIPRAVWPDKPMADTGYWFSVQVWGQDPHLRNSVALTWPGVLHLQFGLPSVLLGMFIVGILLRFFHERYGRDRSDYSLFFYVLILAVALRIDDDLSWLLVGAVRTFVMLWLISLLAFRYPRLARAPAHKAGPAGRAPVLAGTAS